jgi:hypothetical protein
MIGAPPGLNGKGGFGGKQAPLGGSSKKMMDLASLVIDEEDFEQSFAETKNET